MPMSLSTPKDCEAEFCTSYLFSVNKFILDKNDSLR